MTKKTTTYQDKNLELHRRWLELKALEDQNSHEATVLRRNLGNDVITSNKRMIGSEINKYAVHSPDLEYDLFNTAAAALWRAFQKWDPERGTLRTVAMPYIRGDVRREMVRHDHPHLSYDDYTLRGSVIKARREFELKHRKVPTLRELSEVTKVPESKLAVLFADNPVSLDKPMGGSDNDDTTLESAIAEREQLDNVAGAVESYAELNSQLEPETVENADPMDLMVHLMREKTAASAGARISEVSYMLGLPNTRKLSKDSVNFTLHNAYTKLRRMLGHAPSDEQMHLVSGVSLHSVGAYMREKDILEARKVLRQRYLIEPDAQLLAEATGHDVSAIEEIIGA